MAMATFTSSFGKNNGEDGEIGIFGAEKYFNGSTEIDSGCPIPTKKDSKKLELKKHDVINQDPMKPFAPSLRSESSWNSQNPLLPNSVMIQNPPLPKPSKPVNGKSFLSSLAGCKCYCFDRNSIDIEVGEISFKRPNGEVILQSKQNKTTGAVKEDLFTFPTMNSTVGVRPIKVPSQGDVDEIGRKSLEVFGSPVLGIGRRNKSLNLERRRKMLSWDHGIPKVEETENHPSKGTCNDTESDASSDLFEIESLTGKPNHCYAPSEASIEWSVVTASAADYDERRPSTSLSSPIKTFPSAADTRKLSKEFGVQRQSHSQSPRSLGLLGCNSSKSVKIAGDVHKTNPKSGLDPSMRRVSDSYIPLPRFRSENQVDSSGGFESKGTPRILTARSLPIPHSSSQASHLL